MRSAVIAVAILTLAGCGDNEPPSSASPDARPDGVKVTGCEDPLLWSAPALEVGRLNAHVGGGPCEPGQYPLHQIDVSWSPTGSLDYELADRTCWRVTATTAASGWTAGQTFSGDRNGARIAITGFGARLSIEGRVLGADGTVLYAIAPDDAYLDNSNVIDSDASDTTVVVSPRHWVERNAVHFFDLEAGIDEVVDATAWPQTVSAPITVHRTASGFVRRTWRKSIDQLRYEQLVLGTGTRARIAKFGRAIVIDSELVLVAHQDGTPVIDRRIPLTAEPLGLAGGFYSTMLHMPGELVIYAQDGTHSVAVGDGVLLPVPRDDAPVFFDGDTFHEIDRSVPMLGASFTPRPDDLAAIGPPVAVFHGIVFGERGLLLGIDGATEILGPRLATYADLFGDPDARLGLVAVDSSAYVIHRGDGEAALYDVPFVDYCE